MRTASARFEEIVADLNRRVVEAEMRSTAAADGLAALIRTDVDTIEAERHLTEAMDTLLALRRQLCELQSPGGA